MVRHVFAAGLIVLCAGGAGAQDVSLPSVTVANPGGYANPLKLDTDRYRRAQRANRVPPANARASRCSADALPQAERRRMELEYARRFRASGKASADRWAAEQGRRFRAHLVAQGVCPAAGGREGIATNVKPRPSVRDRRGGKCTKTVMQARNIANPGGGAMSMIMVPVCVN